MAPTTLSPVEAVMYRLGKANSDGLAELGNLLMVMTVKEKHDELAALWKKRAEYNGIPAARRTEVARCILLQKNTAGLAVAPTPTAQAS